MRTLGLLAVLGAALIQFGCSDDSTPTPDIGQRDGAISDGVKKPDAMAPDGAPPAPAAPVITAPKADAKVFGKITVEGTGEADATLTVRVLKGSTELGNAKGAVASA